jgi:hypothetical protein
MNNPHLYLSFNPPPLLRRLLRKMYVNKICQTFDIKCRIILQQVLACGRTRFYLVLNLHEQLYCAGFKLTASGLERVLLRSFRYKQGRMTPFLNGTLFILTFFYNRLVKIQVRITIQHPLDCSKGPLNGDL